MTRSSRGEHNNIAILILIFKTGDVLHIALSAQLILAFIVHQTMNRSIYRSNY